jgi:hypothetical protein
MRSSMKLIPVTLLICLSILLFNCRLRDNKLLKHIANEQKRLEEEHNLMESLHDSLSSTFLIILEKRIKRMENRLDSILIKSSVKRDSVLAARRNLPDNSDQEYAILIDEHSKIIQTHGDLLARHEQLILENQKGRLDEELMRRDKVIIEEDKKMKQKHEEITHSFIISDF